MLDEASSQLWPSPEQPARSCTICSVQARRRRQTIVSSVPPRMIGLLRPKRVRRRSLSVPAVGPMKAPESGRTIVMAAAADLERPSFWRYG